MFEALVCYDANGGPSLGFGAGSVNNGHYSHAANIVLKFSASVLFDETALNR
jgi:hypothetical protein